MSHNRIYNAFSEAQERENKIKIFAEGLLFFYKKGGNDLLLLMDELQTDTIPDLIKELSESYKNNITAQELIRFLKLKSQISSNDEITLNQNTNSKNKTTPKEPRQKKSKIAYKNRLLAGNFIGIEKTKNISLENELSVSHSKKFNNKSSN